MQPIQQKDIKAGNVLLAEPFMRDGNFKRAAIFLCEHNEDGSLGFVMNKPLNMQVNELIADFPAFEAEVYFGGPVQTDTIHYIHDVGNLLEGSTKVVEGVYWGGNFSKLKFLISSGLIKPENIRFFVGYSGWSSGQLWEEMLQQSWVLSQMHANYLFKSKAAMLWEEVMNHKGGTFSVIARMPNQPTWN
ncbi:MAG: YqgE/AlgH family protein [Bacteroidota bacterium]